MNAKDIIAAARIKVLNRHPYLSAVLLSLKAVETPGIGTLAVDSGWRLYYDPQTVEEWGVGGPGAGSGGTAGKGSDGTAAVLAHETWHCLREHFKRRGNRDPELSNLGEDCVAKGTRVLLANGHEIPVENVRPGMQIFGVQKGRVVQGTVLLVKTGKKHGYGVEICSRTGMLISTFGHRVLTEDGYVSIREGIGTQEQPAQIFRLREGVHLGQLLQDDHIANGRGDEPPLSKYTVVHATSRHVPATQFRETRFRFDHSRTEPGGIGVFGRRGGWRRDNIYRPALPQGDASDLLSALLAGKQHQHDLEGMDGDSRIQDLPVCQQLPNSMLENVYHWPGSAFEPGAALAVLGHQEEARRASDRVLPHQTWANPQKRPDATDAPDLFGTETLERAFCTTTRVLIPKGEIFYDLITTCHSFVANGFAVHNCEINDDIIKAGWKFPANPMLPSTFGMKDGLTFEEYYEIIQKKVVKVKITVSNMPGCGGKCGGCAGNPHDWEPKDGKDGQGGGESQDGPGKDGGTPGVSQIEQAVARRVVAHEVQKAAQKGRGNMPAGLVAWAEVELAPPKIDWRKQLASLVRGVIASVRGAVDFTYSRPSRRQWAMRAAFGSKAPIMPALHQPVPKVVGVLDVSGSMAGGPALAARSEIVGVCKAVGSPVEWLATDTRVAARAKVGSKRDIAKLGDTQGGTDLRTGIAEALKLQPHIVLTISDGYTPWPTREDLKGIRLIACITPGGEKPPEHIRYVQIEKD